jgi:hypothetical protein
LFGVGARPESTTGRCSFRAAETPHTAPAGKTCSRYLVHVKDLLQPCIGCGVARPFPAGGRLAQLDAGFRAAHCRRKLAQFLGHQVGALDGDAETAVAQARRLVGRVDRVLAALAIVAADVSGVAVGKRTEIEEVPA